MPSLLAQVRIPYRSGLAEDVSINSFSFLTQDTSDTTLQTIKTRLNSFYNGVSGLAVTPVANQFSGSVDGTMSRLKIYNRAHGKPRAPIFDESMPTGGSGAGGGFPEEVAICLSFRGPLLSGKVPARRRGRVYIGPLQAADSVSFGDGRVRPVDDLRISLVEAGKALMDATDAQVDWVVHSQVSVPTDQDTTVVHCWVDDAFDTQRRRGASPTSRMTRNRSSLLP